MSAYPKVQVYMDGSLKIDGVAVPHQGLQMKWSLDTREWSVVVRLPVVDLMDRIPDPAIAYVAGFDGLSGRPELVEATGGTVPEALRALAEKVEAA